MSKNLSPAACRASATFSVLVKKLCALSMWLLWRLTGLVLKVISFGSVDLFQTKIDSSAVGYIWALLWPYLISTRPWPICLPKSISLPWWTCAWQRPIACNWIWTPSLLISGSGVIYYYDPAAASSIVHWLVPYGSSINLWQCLLGSHFLAAVAMCVALHYGLDTAINSFQLRVPIPECRYSAISLALPMGGRKVLTLPLMCQPWLLFGLIGLGCWAVNHYGVEAIKLNGALFNALSEKDAPAFMHVLQSFVMLMAAMTFIKPAYDWVKNVLILCWTRFCTALLLDEYTDKDVQGYYAISLRKIPDNPNERIQQDTPNMCKLVMALLLDLLDAVITLYLFGQVLWGIESALKFEVPLFGHTLVIGHMMLAALIFYAIFGTNGAVRVGKTLIGLNAEQRKLGAHFRVLMVMFEKYAEPIAAYRGEQREYDQLWRRFAAALANNYVIVRWQMLLSVFTGAYGKVAQFLPLLTLAPFYFSGAIELGAISQSAGSCAEILGALSLIVSSFGSISEMLAYANRNGELRQALASIKADRHLIRPRIEREEVDSELLVISGLDLYLPGGDKLIVSDLNLQMLPGESVLIRGPSGAGKTSLLRAIQGLPLWDWGRGKIRIVPHGQRMMLSQLAYLLTEGNLKEQLLYPAATNVSDEELVAALEKVNLSHLLERLAAEARTTTANWSSLSDGERRHILLEATINWDSLSGGERQRLVVARALVNKVLLVIADECTSGLDQKNEELLYRDMKDAGITVLSVGHRASLLPFHASVIELLNDGKGGWRELPAAQCQWS